MTPSDANTIPYIPSPALAMQWGHEGLISYMRQIGANAIVWDEEEGRLVWASVEVEVGRG